MKHVVHEVKARGARAERAIEAEAQECERPIEPGVDELSPVAPDDERPPIDILNRRVPLDHETIVVDKAVSDVSDVGEERHPGDEPNIRGPFHGKNKAAGPAIGEPGRGSKSETR